MNQAILYTMKPLQPVRGAVASFGVRPSSNQTWLKGLLLAVITAVAASEVQTLTGSATGGTFKLSFNGYVTAALNYNATAAQVQAAVQALPNVGTENFTCTGGALGTNPVVGTFANDLANLPQNLLVVVQSTLTGGSVTIARTTAGVPAGRWVSYDGTKVANPTTAPTLTDGAAGSFPAGTYSMAYTYVTAGGESLPSTPGVYASAGTKKIHVAALTGIPAGVTAVNFYLNGMYVYQKAVATNATAAFDMDVADMVAGGAAIPTVSTAYLYGDGRQVARAISQWDLVSDEGGKITLGTTITSQFGSRRVDVEALYAGTFLASSLVGLDLNALTQLGGRVLRGTGISDPNAEILIPGI